METTSILPNDVLEEEILVRLPVKYLLRWKCVCKRWYSLIGDHGFAKRHFHFQYAMQGGHNDAAPLFLDCPSYGEPSEFYLLSRDGDEDVVLDISCDFERDIPPTFDKDCGLRNDSLRCIGVMNGVVGLKWSPTRLTLWNPATREFKDVARWPIIPHNKVAEELGGQIHGLIFDQQSNDFKILGLISFDVCRRPRASTIYEFHLYSLKSNSWKRINKGLSCQINIIYSDRDACLNNGVCYWLASTWDHMNTIISFDVKTENFTEIEYPESIEFHKKQDTCEPQIGKYREGIALFVTRTLENAVCSFEIWGVTKKDDGGVPLSWEPVLKVEPIPSFNWSSLYVKAYRGGCCGDLVVDIMHGITNTLEDEEASIYDPSTRTYKNLGLSFSSSYKYVESLFSLSSG